MPSRQTRRAPDDDPEARQSRAVVIRAEEVLEKTGQLLDDQSSALMAVLPAFGLDPDRFKAVAVRAIARDPKLIRCHPASLIRSIMDAATVGLEPTGGAFSPCYLVPFWSTKKGRYEATLIVGYRGLAHLARRSGLVSTVKAQVVYEADEFDMTEGYPDSHLTHRRKLSGDRGKVIGAWAMLTNVDGSPPLFRFIDEGEIEKRRKVSKAGRREDGSPAGVWLEWPDEQRMKTALRYTLSYAPLAVQMVVATAIDVEDRGDSLLATSGREPRQLPAGSATRRRRMAAALAEPRAQAALAETEGDEAPGTTETKAGAEVTPTPTPTDGVAGQPQQPPPPAESAGADPAATLCADPNPYGGQPCGLAKDHLKARGATKIHKEIGEQGEVVATWPPK